MQAFLGSVQTVADFFSSIFARLWAFVADYPFVLAAAAMPLFFWLLAEVIRLVRSSSDMRIGKGAKKNRIEKGWRIPSFAAKGRLITIDGKVYQMGGKRGWGKTQRDNHKKAGKEEK